jgi:hypothetical protein
MILRLRAGFLGWLMVSLVTSALAQVRPSGLAQTSVMCGTESRPGWRQIFAFDGSHWKRFRALSDIPEKGDDSARLAQVWQGPMNMILVTIGANLRDTFVQTSYCYRGGGPLIALTHEVRDPSGWSYLASQEYDDSGHALKGSARFFDREPTGKQSRLAKEGGARKAALLNPAVYSRFEDLPFASLYRPLADSEKY